jgi:geranylgeranyl pyrophosphate synthase
MMSVFKKVVAYVKEKNLFGEWVEMLEIFEDVAGKEPIGWDIVSHACVGVGGTIEQTIPGVAAIGCLQIAILAIDDLLDHDPHGIYHKIGEGGAANLASSFQAAGLQVILDEDLPAATKIAAANSLNEMMGMTALGQMRDIQIVDNEADYWEVVRMKSSPYCRAALHVGALLGGASLEVGEQIRELGVIYGELLQIHDDVRDTLKTPAEPDWLNWHPTLPILFAQVVDHPDRERFMALRETIAEPDSLREAQTILIRCGAISYCLDQLVTRYQKAKTLLAEIDLVNPGSFELLFEDMIEPAREMVKALGGTNELDDLIGVVND